MNMELHEDQQLSPEEQAISWRRAFGFLLPLLAKRRKPMLVAFALLSGATVLSLIWPILLKRAFDVNLAAGDYGGLVITTLTITALQGIHLLLQYWQRIRLETIGQDVMVELKQGLFDHILAQDIAFFDRNPVGRLMARVESDTEALRQLFTTTAVVLVGDLLLIGGTFAVMAYYSWRLMLLLLGIMPVLAVMITIFARTTTPRFDAVRKKTAEMIATLTEFLHGMAIVQIFHRGAYARRRVREVCGDRFKSDAFAEMAVVGFFNFVTFTQYLLIGLVLLFGIAWAREGLLTVGTLSMFIILIWRAYDPIYRTSEQLGIIQKAFAGAKRIYALLATKARVLDPVRPVEWPRLKQGIRFDNVSFSYNGDDDYALKNASFEVPVGQRFALAGVTGGGKSTVINLLLRFYDPQHGRILVDGIDIREMTQEELRRRFALVLQDIYLFPGDVRSNIALENAEYSDDRVASAAQTVDAHRFIERLPKGYRTEVSEKGANFSRGERQLLSFARALVVNPDLLILDEATSSVDPETERSIQSALKVLMSGRTSLVIAHRLSTILDVDQILVIRRGEIVERGTHTELILQNGYYSKLFHLQYKSRNGVAVNVG
ncbi:ABC transporter ATP-binding protein [candidate division GN15 bacterium]|uniref:ABC transporter ATP-binding protein n=1 Tax=candidate division GN15 bacterium TaxID=2072418 RepID=A0A855X522_9BACT|nr:MAG: ABC transporter ATP-binding protein [candidate division GN15 bacterium]